MMKGDIIWTKEEIEKRMKEAYAKLIEALSLLDPIKSESQMNQRSMKLL